MIADEWQTTRTRSTVVPTSSEAILAQALPGRLATPAGWRSEIIRSTSATSNDSETNLINTGTRVVGKHEEYKTLNTTDAPPMIFSSTSTNEANRVVHEIPSTTILSSRTISGNSVSEYNEASICESSSQKQKKSVIKEQQQEPLIIRKTLPNNTVTYQQNVSIRYLQPPTPPPPEPLIIREIRPPPPPPQSPVKVRQRPPPPDTPPPLIIRERPPPAPPRLPSQIVEKLLPPPPRPPRRLIVERFAECPPKPADVVIERWLPYRRSDQRRILFERAPAPYIPPREPNLLILHNQPHARIHKEFINQGVSRVDPYAYLQQYGAEIDSWHIKSRYAYLINEADHALPPPRPLPPRGPPHDYHGGYQLSPVATAWERMKSVPPLSHPFAPTSGYHDYHGGYPSSPVATAWERMKSISPLPHSLAPSGSYHGGYPSSPVATAWDRMRSVSPLPHSLAPTSGYHDYHGGYPSSPIATAWDRMKSVPPLPHALAPSSSYHGGYPSPPVATAWERMKSVSPLPHSLSYQHNYPQYDSPYHPSIQSPINYNNYGSYRGDIRTMVDVTPSWKCICNPILPSHELHRSLSGLSIGHEPRLLHCY